MDNFHTFRLALLHWFESAAAAFPWRREPTPYHVWLSEIMLQQTQVTTVIPYFRRFLEKYPEVRDLSAAPLDEVLKAWEGLGYYSRARNLHRTAQMVTHQFGGAFPRTAEMLQVLPGIGRYTASAIASIAFGERAAVLDGNVIRVLARLFDVSGDVSKTATQKHLWQLAEGLIQDSERPGDHNQAMMELGREVCKPRKPDCPHCPVQGFCLAHLKGTQAMRPVKPLKRKIPHYDLAAAVITDSRGQVLIVQRPLDGLLGGLWEFPAVQYEANENPEASLSRKLATILGIDIEVGHHLLKVNHAFTHFKITVQVFECHLLGGTITLQGYPAYQWVRWDEIERFAFGRVDRRVIAYWKEAERRLF